MIKMAQYADRTGIKVAFGAISPVNDYIPGKDLLTSHPLDEVKALNDWIAGFCAQNGYEFIDFYSAVADEQGKLAEELTDDGMHCNAAGYNRWKPLVIQVLKNWDVWKD
jgi:lysophospholipase L1-like esterase